MRKTVTLLILLLLITSSLISITSTAVEKPNTLLITTSNNFAKGYRFHNQGWIYLHIEGTPYERGYQHGYLLAPEIEDMVNRWSHIIHNYPKISRISQRLTQERYDEIAQKWWEFCQSNCQKMYWDKIPAEYKLEITGIADGAKDQGAKIFGEPINYLDILTINEMYEFMSKLTRIPMSIHPLRTFLQQLKQDIPEMQFLNVNDLILTFLNQEPAHHCNGFIATGDATTNGQLVVSQSTICGGGMWWWTYYISLRWNIIIDVKPVDGNRFVISTSPGFIWSDEDYYQNENGITFLETTLPQGVYDNIGLPLSVRARNAVQYANTIDDVVNLLLNKNDGSMNAVWLIGDTKTGEIARFELGYRKHAIWRTYNGFLWSANNPYDLGVRIEKFNPKKYVQRLLWSFAGIPGFGYYSLFYRPESRDIKYEELGNKFYGNIDAEVVKEIMSTSPISDYITDCKVSDSWIIPQNGLWAFFGNSQGKILNMSNLDEPKIKYEDVHPCGWTRFFGLPEKGDYTVRTVPFEETDPMQIIWEYETDVDANDFTASSAVLGEVLYVTTSEGFLYALNITNGDLIWKKNVGLHPTAPTVFSDYIFIGSQNGVIALNTNGNILWEKSSERVMCAPIVVDDVVVFADKLGCVSCVSYAGGFELWSRDLIFEPYIASYDDNLLFVGVGQSCVALHVNDGSTVWEYETFGPITSCPVVYGSLVYFGSWDTYFYALDKTTGELVWSFEAGWGFDSKPIVSEGVVYVGCHDNNMYALDALDGEVKWVFSTKSGIHSNPVVLDEQLVFGCDDGRLYCLDKNSGILIGFFSPGFTVDDDVYNYIVTPVVSDPFVDDDVFIGIKGTMYSLEI